MSESLIDFLRENYIWAVYALTLIISIWSYRKYFDTALRYFPIIIAYTLFNEVLGHMIRYSESFSLFTKEGWENVNDLIYNIYSPIFFGYFYFVYWQLNSSARYKQIIKWAAFAMFLAFIVNAIFHNPLRINMYYANGFASWMLLCCIILYFINRVNWSWNHEKYNLVTWVSAGLTLFYFFFPILFFIGYFKFEIWQQYHLRTVLRILIVIMYLFFCIGFIISRRRAFK